MKLISINGEDYHIIKLLGKGKGGYSYLAQGNDEKFVLKQIHHEPCSYYTFGNKIEAELNDYKRLKEVGIQIPKMLDVDVENERILKEYIEGPTAFELVLNDKMLKSYIEQIKQMCKLLYPAKLNIDYFPTNFVLHNDTLWYIDFECNEYSDKWNFENWGILYWSKTKEFCDYIKEHS